MIARALDGVVMLLTAAILLIAATGGIDFGLGPLHVRLHDWTRPLAILGVAIAARIWLARRAPVTPFALDAPDAPIAPAPIAPVVARGMLALLLAAAGVYAHAHIRVAGGLDSYGYVSAAHLVASGRLREAQPLAAVLPFDNAMSAAAPLGHVPSADGRTSVPRFPLGLPIVMALFTMFGSSGPFFVPLLMAYAAIVLAYLLGRDAGAAGTIRHAPGLFAAALVAVDPLFAAYAIQPMSDVPATGWMLAAVWAARDTNKGLRPLFGGIGAGVCAGMAILTRPALLPAIIVLVLVTAGRKRSRLVMFGGTVAAFIALQLALNVALYGGLGASGYGSPSHMFELSLPRLVANASNFGKWLTYSHTALFWLLWPGALFVLRRQPSAWHMSAVAAAAAIPYLFYLVFDDWESSRFLLPSIALILILFARAVAHLFSATPRLARAEGSSHVFMLAMAFACAAASHRFLDREGIYRLPTLEAKYALAGEWFKANTSERVVVLAGLHSGTIRLYGERATIRWDQIPEQALTATLRALIDAGYEPYLALDLPSEPPLFEERFRKQPPHAEQIARVRVVNIYKLVSAY